ncbi:hypothetical protein [Carnobacterium pleistocenium]|uniref:hypothetical protein n=1 Tax=Carnobacterium pleistocenium TaxID=181073 RepID=UPI00055672E3|nr:hypothetical protein [Carnobacterium pleistocenium]
MSDYVSLITISGILGLINYWVFSAMNLLDFFDHNESDEKISLIIGLGMINFVINDILIYLSKDKWLLGLYIIASFSIAFFIEILLFFILKWISGFIRKQFFKDKKSIRSYSTVIKNLLEEDIGSDKELYGYIYDFSDNIIEHGRIKYYAPNNKEEHSMAIQIDPGSDKIETDFKKLRPELPIDKTMDVYINFEHQYKLYIFIEDKAEKDS